MTAACLVQLSLGQLQLRLSIASFQGLLSLRRACDAWIQFAGRRVSPKLASCFIPANLAAKFLLPGACSSILCSDRLTQSAAEVPMPRLQTVEDVRLEDN